MGLVERLEVLFLRAKDLSCLGCLGGYGGDLCAYRLFRLGGLRCPGGLLFHVSSFLWRLYYYSKADMASVRKALARRTGPLPFILRW